MDLEFKVNQKRLRRLAKMCGKYLHWILLGILGFSIFIGILYLLAELRVTVSTVVKPSTDRLMNQQHIFL